MIPPTRKKSRNVNRPNLNTLLLSLLIPGMAYLAVTDHAIDVRVARIEQQLIDGHFGAAVHRAAPVLAGSGAGITLPAFNFSR